MDTVVELTHLVGVVLALGAAFAVAVHHLLVRLGTDEGSAYDAVLVVMVVNSLVLLPVMAVLYYPEYGLTRQSWLSFVAAGLAGTLFGRACMYTSIERIGASRTAPIVASWGLISTLLGVFVLDESLSAFHAVGVVLVVGGVAVIAWETSQENPEDLSTRELSIGLLLPFAAAVAFGWEPIFAKFGIAAGTPAPVGLVVKTVSASLGFVGYLSWRDRLPDLQAIETADTKLFVLAGIANTLFLLGYYLALELVAVSIVGPIVVTNTLFVIVLSAIFMPERLERVTLTLVTAATVAVVGVVIITVYG